MRECNEPRSATHLHEDAVKECQTTGMTQSSAAKQQAVVPTNVNMPGHVLCSSLMHITAWQNKYLREHFLHNPELFTHA